MRPEQVNRVERHEPHRSRRAAPVDDPAVLDRPCPRRSAPCAREQPRRRARPRRASSSTAGSSALIDGPVVARPGSRRSAPSPRRTPRRSDADRDGRARNSASRRSTDGTCRSARAESCSPRRRGACPASIADTCALSGAPMLPPTVTLNPAASSIRPVSAVVVDLPFVPVIAITRPAASATRARARR